MTRTQVMPDTTALRGMLGLTGLAFTLYGIFFVSAQTPNFFPALLAGGMVSAFGVILFGFYVYWELSDGLDKVNRGLIQPVREQWRRLETAAVEWLRPQDLVGRPLADPCLGPSEAEASALTRAADVDGAKHEIDAIADDAIVVLVVLVSLIRSGDLSARQLLAFIEWLGAGQAYPNRR
jgi:hypothetical protein